MAKVTLKHLTGLKFSGSTPKDVTEEGRKKTKYVPFERDLTLDDILSQNDYGDYFVIVTKGGVKYTIPKKQTAQGADDPGGAGEGGKTDE